MGTHILPPDLAGKVARLYQDMETAYDGLARRLGFSCQGCPDNCCDSYFQHHTYTDWAFLWEGLRKLSEEKQNTVVGRATTCVAEYRRALAEGKRPVTMCPINEEGLCALYPYRLMICRMHGVPSAMTRPDGRRIEFPGCFRCQEMVGGRSDISPLDRTPLYQRLVAIEMEWLGPRRSLLPKVKMTLAEMIVAGPPAFPF